MSFNIHFSGVHRFNPSQHLSKQTESKRRTLSKDRGTVEVQVPIETPPKACMIDWPMSKPPGLVEKLMRRALPFTGKPIIVSGQQKKDLEESIDAVLDKAERERWREPDLRIKSIVTLSPGNWRQIYYEKDEPPDPDKVQAHIQQKRQDLLQKMADPNWEGFQDWHYRKGLKTPLKRLAQTQRHIRTDQLVRRITVPLRRIYTRWFGYSKMRESQPSIRAENPYDPPKTSA